jgi:hypothetical protein
MNGRVGEASDRLRVLAGNMKDPYDNYHFLEEVHHDHLENLRYFILNADYGGDDNNVTISSSSFHKLLKRLDLHQQVGIHPSLASNDDFSVLQSEISELSLVLQRNITISRQHFLKLEFPNTYLALMQSAILHDYSLGYASHPGFRAGIAMPYPFFDLLVNKPASLIIHPVTLMDVTFKDYLRLNPNESLSAISSLVQKVKDVNGELVTIWHNESLGDQGRWKGWREVYKEMVKMASAQ